MCAQRFKYTDVCYSSLHTCANIIYTYKYINIHGEVECLLVEHNIQKYCAVNLNNSLEKEMVLGP